jgi:hypothetical protein
MMDRELEKHLTRIEGKINIVARGVGYTVGIVAGFGAYYVSRNEPWAIYYGFGAAILLGGMVEFPIRSLEKRLPYDQAKN